MKQTKKQEEPTSENKEQEYLDGWKRALADLENAQKRMAENAVSQRAAIKRDIVESFLSLADNFRSLALHAPTNQDAWAQGVVHVARQFDQTLQGFGVEMITDTGGTFNPAIHEAVEEVKTKEKEKIGTIAEVVQPGYKIGDITIRPAKVKTYH
jgi:molecular chaperone GrpE